MEDAFDQLDDAGAAVEAALGPAHGPVAVPVAEEEEHRVGGQTAQGGDHDQGPEAHLVGHEDHPAVPRIGGQEPERVVLHQRRVHGVADGAERHQDDDRRDDQRQPAAARSDPGRVQARDGSRRLS